jgi:hypothetical protein
MVLTLSLGNAIKAFKLEDTSRVPPECNEPENFQRRIALTPSGLWGAQTTQSIKKAKETQQNQILAFVALLFPALVVHHAANHFTFFFFSTVVP